MIHILFEDEKELHSIEENDTTCNCNYRCKVLPNGDLILIHEITTVDRQLTDTDIVQILKLFNDEPDGNIHVEDL